MIASGEGKVCAKNQLDPSRRFVIAHCFHNQTDGRMDVRMMTIASTYRSANNVLPTCHILYRSKQ